MSRIFLVKFCSYIYLYTISDLATYREMVAVAAVGLWDTNNWEVQNVTHLAAGTLRFDSKGKLSSLDQNYFSLGDGSSHFSYLDPV